MTFTYTPELLAYMKQKNCSTILVELIELNNTDLEIMELSVRLADERTRARFVNQKQYRVVPTDAGEVLLPKFPLDYSDTISFGLRKILFFRQITCKGISVPKPI
ncbi:MAG: hypothetical protein E7429_01470 [Ruminococcaceae bacterium]|nr:hypothetical protein [Oscillospiraceae bacterium]